MCKHINAKLTITWGEQANITGPNVDTYKIIPGSLTVRLDSCPDCGLKGSLSLIFTTRDGWEDRWPQWLKQRVSALATGYQSIRYHRTPAPPAAADQESSTQ